MRLDWTEATDAQESDFGRTLCLIDRPEIVPRAEVVRMRMRARSSQGRHPTYPTRDRSVWRIDLDPAVLRLTASQAFHDNSES